MALKKASTRKRVPYPYQFAAIPQLDRDMSRQLDPWAVCEFFRIEALLRSPTVHRMYRKGGTGLELYQRYEISWSNLKGEHHVLLQPRRLVEAGILDMDELGKYPKHSAIHLLGQLRYEPPRFLHLQIDCAYPPKTVIEALQPILKERNRAINIDLQRERWRPWPHHPRKRSPIQDLHAWTQRLACYDLFHHTALSPGKIGIKVYGDLEGKTHTQRKRRDTVRDETKRAIRKVELLIRAAEQGPWPPQSI